DQLRAFLLGPARAFGQRSQIRRRDWEIIRRVGRPDKPLANEIDDVVAHLAAEPRPGRHLAQSTANGLVDAVGIIAIFKGLPPKGARSRQAPRLLWSAMTRKAERAIEFLAPHKSLRIPTLDNSGMVHVVGSD